MTEQIIERLFQLPLATDLSVVLSPRDLVIIAEFIQDEYAHYSE